MSDQFLIVWRAINGGAVITYSTDDKKPRVFSNEDPETTQAYDTSEDELTSLVSSKEPFGMKKVPLNLAEHLLGWTIAANA